MWSRSSGDSSTAASRRATMPDQADPCSLRKACRTPLDAAVLVHGYMRGKLWALRALWRMFRYLRNWRDVWAAYRVSQALPALQFRRGFVLNHGPADDPIV